MWNIYSLNESMYESNYMAMTMYVIYIQYSCINLHAGLFRHEENLSVSYSLGYFIFLG